MKGYKIHSPSFGGWFSTCLLAGICPGAGYASLGIGNAVMLYGVAGVLLRAYLQGGLRESVTSDVAVTADRSVFEFW